MIRYLIAFLLIASPCLAGMGIGGFPQPGPGVVIAAAPSGDSCADGFVLSWHAENVDVTQGTPAGCSAIGDSVATANSTVTLDGTSVSDGSYAILSNAAYEYYTLNPITGVSSAEGTVYVDVNINAFSTGSAFFVMQYNASNAIRLELSGASSAVDIRGYYVGEGTTQTLYNGTCDIDVAGNPNQWVRVKYQWKVSATGAGHKIDVWNLDSSLPRQVTTLRSSNAAEDTLTAFASEITEIKIGGITTAGYIVDNIKIYSTSGL